MSAIETLRSGNVQQAFDELKAEVMAAPENPKHRIFLFQMLTVLGRWDRALTQLNVLRDLDPGALAMVQTYQESLNCEALRSRVFAGLTSPVIFGEPEPWIAWLQESLQRLANGQFEAALDLRNRAFDAAPATPGTLILRTEAAANVKSDDVSKGDSFEWMADADQRLGPILEAIINGSYYWVPMHRIQRIDIELPADLRDVVWMPAHFMWANGGEAVGLIPTRYCGSEEHPDDLVKLARKTEWQESEGGFVGFGQRLLATDANEYALMDIAQIQFCPALNQTSASGAEGDETTNASADLEQQTNAHSAGSDSSVQ